MNLREIEAFRAVYVTGSISRAAEALHISQPSVSRLIGNLEASVKLKLFTRAPSGVEPTPEARHLYGIVERSFVGLAEIRDAATAIRAIETGAISLGVIPALAFSVVPHSVGRQHSTSSGIRYNVNISSTPEITEAVAAGQIDLGVVSPIQPPRNVDVIFSKSFSYYCIVPISHPLAMGDSPLDLLSLTEEEFITFDPDYLEFIGATTTLKELMQRRSRISSHSAPEIAALALATGTVAIVDPFTAELIETLGGMVCKEIMQNLRYEVALITRRNRPLSIAARQLVGILEDVINTEGQLPRTRRSAKK